MAESNKGNVNHCCQWILYRVITCVKVDLKKLFKVYIYTSACVANTLVCVQIKSKKIMLPLSWLILRLGLGSISWRRGMVRGLETMAAIGVFLWDHGLVMAEGWLYENTCSTFTSSVKWPCERHSKTICLLYRGWRRDAVPWIHFLKWRCLSVSLVFLWAFLYP